MTTEDDLFEQRFTESLLQRGKISAPPLTPERKASLMAKVTAARESSPALPLVWRRIVGTTREILTMGKTIGVLLLDSPAPVMRDGGEEKSRVESAMLQFQGGELHIQAIADSNHRTRLLLSVKGDSEQRDDLSVELSLGEELIEARPLEKRAELFVDGTGEFRLDLFAGAEEIATLCLPIGEETDHD